MRFRHSGKLGDIVYSLAAVRAFEDSSFFVNPGSHLTQEAAAAILPLLSAQPYITESALWAEQEYDYDLDSFRRHPGLSFTNIASCHLESLRLPDDLKDVRWLSVPSRPILPGSGVVFARSNSYRGAPGVMELLYKSLGKGALFVGNEEDWETFNREVGAISFVRTSNLLAVAEIIEASRLFIGNQSCPLAIAEGLKVPAIQEVHHAIPNCLSYRCDVFHAFVPMQIPSIVSQVRDLCT